MPNNLRFWFQIDVWTDRKLPPVPINMTSYWPSSASTRSTTICVSLYGTLAFTSTGWRRAGYTGRHISGWFRANCSTESGKSFVLPNSLPGWLVILLGH